MSTSAATKTDLLLLGLLLDRPMHGYELYQQVQAEGIDGWFHLSAAGIYYSLRKLRDQGLVAESRQHRGGSSRKSVYRLTEQGRVAFFEALEHELASEEQTYLEYDLAIYLLNRFPLQRAMPQLEKRREFLAERARQVQRAYVAEQNNGSSPLKLAILDHKRRFLEMETDWLADVVCSIQADEEVCADSSSKRRGLMELSGDLRNFYLPDLIRLIVAGQHSGALTITDGAEVRTLGFQEGRPAWASFVRQGEPPRSPDSCQEVLDGLCELFRWQEGRFSFDQRAEFQDCCVPVECTAEDLILRGCRRVDTWDIIQRLVPSAETIFERGSAHQHLAQLTLTPTEEQVADAVDGVKDVATVARELNLTLFETSRAFYCLTAIGVLRAADLDKTRLRRVFREIAELMCSSTLPWRSAPDDRSCEQEVNELCKTLPLCLDHGRIQDETDPQLSVKEMKEAYHFFLQQQFAVVSRRFGRSNARQSFERTLRQLAPELQDVAKRHGFDGVAVN
jgi:DNA-binding PadR family transcriptional regulator